MLAIMQPYIFPYIGYFHLLDAAEKIIFYDDVNFIKGGFINRNKILLNGNEFIFTVPLEKVSQNKLIYEINPIIDDKFRNKFFNQIGAAYSKAPHFDAVSELIYDVFEQGNLSIADLAIKSILAVYQYLSLELNYDKSSVCSHGTRGMNKADRLIKITHESGYKKYVNSIGGSKLYTKEYFFENGIELFFVSSDAIIYKQFKNEFVPNLSIIDILMHNEIDTVNSFIKKYTLI